MKFGGKEIAAVNGGAVNGGAVYLISGFTVYMSAQVYGGFHFPSVNVS